MTTPTSALIRSFLPGGQVCGRADGTLADPGHVIAQHGDVADLAAGPYGLAIKMQLYARVRGHHVRVPGVDVGVGATEHVGHGHAVGGCARVAEGQVEHGSQVLLELGVPGALERPEA